MSKKKDKLLFAEELNNSQQDKKTEEFWKVIIVDDEQEVHVVTKLVLGGLEFKGKALYFISAFSEKDAKKRIEENPDAALVLLDVVMEEEDSGLRLVKYIRENLGNNNVRIILRTGQPGQAPEDKVIIEYDINDYKEKTELSYKKLLASVISSLRTFNDIQTILQLNSSLEQKVEQRTTELAEANQRLSRSLNKLKADQVAGRKIQNKLLPAPGMSLLGYEFSRILFPSMYLSGDFIDYFSIDNENLGFYIADVSGHGASSAFITVLLKSFINNQREMYRSQNDKTILNPQSIFTKLNTEFLKENLGKYLTIFYCVLNVNTNTLTYANGGQFPPPFLFDGEKCEFIKSKGIPIGLFENAEFNAYSLTLPPQFLLFLASDGILEFLPQKELDDKLSLLTKFFSSMNIELKDIIDQLAINGTDSLPDDITFLLVKRNK